MIYAIGIEVVRHLGKASTPPSVVILRHLIPVIDWESPVLSLCREVIRRSTRRRGRNEEFRILPYIHARTRYANRNIALQHYPLRVEIVAHLTQLAVEMILHIVVESHLLLVALGKCCASFLNKLREGCPLRKICCLILVAQHREYRIRHQPRTILLLEVAVRLALHTTSTQLLVHLAEILHLRLHYALIIHLWQSIQLRLQSLHLGSVGIATQVAHVAQAKIQRMQSKARQGIIWIGVRPGQRHRGVVDRQNLNHALTSLCAPVTQELKVGKFAHAETMLRAQREYRNGNASTAPLRIVAQAQAFNEVQLLRLWQDMVIATLPAQECAIGTQHYKFIFRVRALAQGDTPAVIAEVGQRQRLLSLPLAQPNRRANNGKFFGQWECRLHLNVVSCTRHHWRRLNRTREDALTEHRRVERSILRSITPVVGHLNRSASCNLGQRMALAPLFALELSSLDNLVAIAIRTVGVQFDNGTPNAIALVTHIQRFALNGYKL